MILNGVDLKAFGNTTIINGQKFGIINGNRPPGYDKWRMVWNGNHFAPPEPNSVIYYPGIPGAGSTIQDFSFTFSDSGIDTDEALDATETGIDCDADATTAIPVGSIIRIEGEYCRVSATGTTLTVKRDFYNGGAATHATNQDIYVWIPNNGTITGATWGKLSSGLSDLVFPSGGGMITVTDAASLDFAAAASFTLKAWVNTSSTANYQQVFNKNDTVNSSLFWILRIEQTNGQVLFRIADGTNTPFKQGDVVVTDGKWHQIIGRRDVVADDLRVFIDGVQDGAAATDTTTATLANNGNLTIGNTSADNRRFVGSMALWEIIAGAETDAQIANSFAQERHKFGV